MIELEDQWKRPGFATEQEVPKVLGLIMRLSGGLVKTREQASRVALVVVVVAVAVSIALLASTGGEETDVAKEYQNVPQFLP